MDHVRFARFFYNFDVPPMLQHNLEILSSTDKIRQNPVIFSLSAKFADNYTTQSVKKSGKEFLSIQCLLFHILK